MHWKRARAGPDEAPAFTRQPSDNHRRAYRWMRKFIIVKIRLLDAEHDLDGYLAVMHQVDRFPRSAAEWRERQRPAGTDAFRRYLVGQLGDRIAAVAAVLDSNMAANGVVVRIVVDARFRGRGHGRAMAAAVGCAARRASARARRDRGPGARRRPDLARLGRAARFRLRNHVIRSRVDLASPDLARHHEVVARVEAGGLRFEVPDDENRVHDLYTRLLRDAPDGVDPPAREWFRRHRHEHPDAVHLVAVDGATWAGLAVATPGEGGSAWNDFTGVAPESRGRGVALGSQMTCNYAKCRVCNLSRRRETSQTRHSSSCEAQVCQLPAAYGTRAVRRRRAVPRPRHSWSERWRPCGRAHWGGGGASLRV